MMNRYGDTKKVLWAKSESFLVAVITSIIAAVVLLLVFGDSSEYYTLKKIGTYGSLIIALLIAAYFLVVRIRDVLTNIKKDATEVSRKQQCIFEDLISKSRSYVDYFYKQAYSLMIKGKLPDDQIRTWDTEELTDFEKMIPSSTLVVIDRPVAISQSIIPSLTDVIKNNTGRGVKYQIIGNIPTELESINNVSKIEISGLENLANASLVLPYFGMALYIVERIEDLPDDQHDLWVAIHIPSHNSTPVSNEVRIRGFATIPYGMIGLEYAYCAVPLSKVDIEQLVRRVWKT